MVYDGKTYRNLQDQVGYLTARLDTQELLNEFGLTVLGRVDTFADLPANDPADPFKYGDAYMVGQEGNTPYRMAIWTRNADGYGNAGWFDIGYFPTAPDQFSIVEVNGEPVHVWNADTKLDKDTSVTILPRAYVKNSDGTQGELDVGGSAGQGKIPIYLADGRLKVGNPIEDGEAANKGYVDNFLLKQIGTSSFRQAYAKDTDGTQYMQPINGKDFDAGENRIALYGTDGRLRVGSPVNDKDATPKAYVDTSTTGKRYLHKLQLTFTISAGIYLSIIGRIINSSNSSITSIGYQEMMDLIVDYGAYEPGGTPQPASVTKCPESFHQDNLDEPNFGFLAYYKSGGTFNQLYVDSTNGIAVTDAVTVF